MQSFLTVLENFKENYLAWVSVLNITVSKTDIVRNAYYCIPVLSRPEMD